MSSKDILDLFIIEDGEIDVKTIIEIVFNEYKAKKKAHSIYNADDFIPQNLIKLYYSRDGEHSDFKDIVSNFKEKYLNQESKLEGVHTKEEVEGLGVVYDYIRGDDWQHCANIYIILQLHSLLFSKTPYPEAGGKLRNSDCYIMNYPVNTLPYNQICSEIASLYTPFGELIKKGIDLGMNNTLSNEDNLIEYINECLKLKCRLIEIHPFFDGNGRTMRALVNLLFKLAGLPPVYVKASEKKKYIEAMDKAVAENNYHYINKFYYYKICDSILELDVNKRIRKDKKLTKIRKKQEI